MTDPAQTVNKTKILHGVFRQHAVMSSLDDEDVEQTIEDSTGSIKKKKSKFKDSQWSKRQKADPNAPSYNRIPLPEMSDSWKACRSQAISEMARRVKLSQEKLPSACFYTLLNASNSTCSCEISEDSSILCAGFNNSTVQVWSLNDQKLKPLKKSADLAKLDKESDDIMDNILDDSNPSSRLTFVGHSGPVYNTSINLDKKLILSCSEDSTVRLWSLHTWTNLVVYRLNDLPFWDVEFGPYGYYFVTGGSDNCALLWALDRQQPLRMFVGHDSDVNCVNFHPNSNYIASGSDDSTVRMWDLSNGECVRHFSDPTGPIQTVQFSSDGRLLAAGTSNGQVLIYDVAQGRPLVNLPAVHDDQSVNALAFSRDNTVLASGGADNKIALHYLLNLRHELTNESAPADKLNELDNLRMGDFYTKSTPVLHLHFTRRNLLLGVGSFGQ